MTDEVGKAFDARKPGQWVLWAFTFPWAITTYLLGLLSLVFFLTRRPRFEGAGILSLTWRDWIAKRNRYSTTFGRTLFWNPRHREPAETMIEELDERIERHERVHIRQVEDKMMLSFIVGLVVAIGHWAHGNAGAGSAWWLGIWWSGGMWQLPNFLTAMLRYGWIGVYRDSEHERSASGQTDRWPDGSSWWERRDERRKTQKKAF